MLLDLVYQMFLLKKIKLFKSRVLRNLKNVLKNYKQTYSKCFSRQTANIKMKEDFSDVNLLNVENPEIFIIRISKN